MDWGLIWSAIGGIAGMLAVLLTLFLEWPRFKERLGQSASTLKKFFQFLSPVLLFFGFILLIIGTTSSSSSTNGNSIGKLGMLLFNSGACVGMAYLAWEHRDKRREFIGSIIFWLALLSAIGFCIFIGDFFYSWLIGSTIS